LLGKVAEEGYDVETAVSNDSTHSFDFGMDINGSFDITQMQPPLSSQGGADGIG